MLFLLAVCCVSVFSVFVSGQQQVTECELINNCTCRVIKTLEGPVSESNLYIDLSSLALDTGKPKYEDVKDIFGDQYSWNPCIPFTQGGCQGVAACQIQPWYQPPLYYVIGLQNTAAFRYNTEMKALTLVYTDGSPSTPRTTVIKLVCDPTIDADFTTQGESFQHQRQYELTLRSRLACPQTIIHDDVVGFGISIGTIICISFIISVTVYISTGILYNVRIKKRSGRDIIPHVQFWVGFPGLVKDGCILVKNRGKVGQSYSSF